MLSCLLKCLRKKWGYVLFAIIIGAAVAAGIIALILPLLMGPIVLATWQIIAAYFAGISGSVWIVVRSCMNQCGKQVPHIDPVPKNPPMP